jgi:mycoredoxin
MSERTLNRSSFIFTAFHYYTKAPHLVMMFENLRRARGENKMDKVKVYGAGWCGDTQRSLKQLDSFGVAYDYIDVEQDAEASRWVKQQNEGRERKPTIKIGEQVLSVPSNQELESALRTSGLVV